MSQFVSRLRLFKDSSSLGGLESQIERRALSEGQGSKVDQGLIRMSIGLEDTEDLFSTDQLSQAFEDESYFGKMTAK